MPVPIIVFIIIVLLAMFGGKTPEKGAAETTKAADVARQASAQTDAILASCMQQLNAVASECDQQRKDRDVVLLPEIRPPSDVGGVTGSWPDQNLPPGVATDQPLPGSILISPSARASYVDVTPVIGAVENKASAVEPCTSDQVAENNCPPKE